MSEKMKLAMVEGLCIGASFGFVLLLSDAIANAVNRKIDDRIKYSSLNKYRDYSRFDD